MPLQIGDVVVSDDGRRYKLVGTIGRSWAGEPLDSFGPVVKLTPRALASYTLEDGGKVADGRAPEPADELAARGALVNRVAELAEKAEPGWSNLVRAHHETMAVAQAELLEEQDFPNGGHHEH